MTTQTLLNLGKLVLTYPDSAFLKLWKEKTGHDIADIFRKYLKAQAMGLGFRFLTEMLGLLAFIEAAIGTWRYASPGYLSFVAAGCFAFNLVIMIAIQIMAMKTRADIRRYNEIIVAFAMSVKAITLASRILRNMPNGYLFTLSNEAAVVNFIESTLVEGALEVIDAEAEKDESRIVKARSSMSGLTEALKPVCGRINVTGHYDRAEKILAEIALDRPA